jgi:hypothetical protein
MGICYGLDRCSPKPHVSKAQFPAQFYWEVAEPLGGGISWKKVGSLGHDFEEDLGTWALPLPLFCTPSHEVSSLLYRSQQDMLPHHRPKATEPTSRNVNKHEPCIFRSWLSQVFCYSNRNLTNTGCARINYGGTHCTAHGKWSNDFLIMQRNVVIPEKDCMLANIWTTFL